jgi:transcription initiation factor TFIID subunit 7
MPPLTAVLENVNPDLSDSEFIEREDGGFGAMGSLNMDESENVAPASVDGDDNDEGDEDEDQEGDIDEELAAELDLALGDDEGEDDDDEDDDESEEDDDEDEDEEGGQALRLLNEEVRDLQAAISKKEKEIASSANPLIRVGATSYSKLFVLICCRNASRTL